MRVTSSRALLVANLVALTSLASLWVDESGQLRNSSWVAPAPVKVDVTPLPFFAKASAPMADPGIFLATLERPLFAPDRKPPPPPPPPAPPAPPPIPDSLAGARLLGIISGPAGSVLIRTEGRVRRVVLNQTLGDWTLKSVGQRDATFERNQETRVVQLEYASLKPLTADVAKAPNIANVPVAQAENFKRQVEERDDLDRRLAAMRAKLKP
jgi:hypothetical protein